MLLVTQIPNEFSVLYGTQSSVQNVHRNPQNEPQIAADKSSPDNQPFYSFNIQLNSPSFYNYVCHVMPSQYHYPSDVLITSGESKRQETPHYVIFSILPPFSLLCTNILLKIFPLPNIRSSSHADFSFPRS
jgi:hypothetical protein